MEQTKTQDVCAGVCVCTRQAKQGETDKVGSKQEAERRVYPGRTSSGASWGMETGERREGEEGKKARHTT